MRRVVVNIMVATAFTVVLLLLQAMLSGGVIAKPLSPAITLLTQSGSTNDASEASNAPTNSNKVHLSIVLTFRLDGYGNNLVQRATRCLQVLYKQLVHHVSPLRPVEVLIVEWGWRDQYDSVAGFLQTLKLQRTEKPITLKVIRVPYEVTRRRDVNPKLLKYLEFNAKNVGIRRAKGHFILCTNVDDLFKGDLVRLMTSDKLEDNAFYRTAFFDVDFNDPNGPKYTHPRVRKMLGGTSPALPPEPNATDIVEWLGQTENQFEYLAPWGYQAYKEVCDVGFSTRFNHSKVPADVRHRIYTSAAGDFTLAPKKAWQEIRGYPELGVDRLDSLALCLMSGKGYEQIMLVQPCSVIHQSHELGRGGRAGFPGTAKACGCLTNQDVHESESADDRYWRCYDAFVDKILRNNPDTWGLAQEKEVLEMNVNLGQQW